MPAAIQTPAFAIATNEMMATAGSGILLMPGRRLCDRSTLCNQARLNDWVSSGSDVGSGVGVDGCGMEAIAALLVVSERTRVSRRDAGSTCRMHPDVLSRRP